MAETSGIEKRWSLFETVPTLVDEKFEYGMGFAATALVDAKLVIEDLRQIGVSLNNIDISTGITYIPPPDSGIFTETLPTSPTTDFDAPTVPDDIVFGESLPSSPNTDFNPPASPDYGDFTGTVPGSPVTDFNMPASPSYGTFTETLPISPNTTWNPPTAPSDADALQSEIRSKLINDISSGGPAISPSVETAIFNRETERALLVHQDTIDNISAEWAKRGFTLSNAILGSLLAQANIDYANKRLDVSRDIAIKNFELSDANVKFAIQQGMVYMANKIAIYKTEVEAEIGRIESIIKKYLSNIESYKAAGQVFSSLAQAEIATFKVEVDAETVRIDSIIKKYLGGIEAYKASGQVFTSLAQVDVTTYKVEVEAELGRIDSIIKKYLGNIEGYKAAGQITTSIAGVDVAKYKVEVEAELGRIDSIIKKYLGNIESYKTAGQVFSALADTNVKEFEVELKQELVKAELLIKNVEIAIKNFEVETAVRLEAAKAVGGINAQLVAGALSAVSASVSMTATNAGEYSYRASDVVVQELKNAAQ